MFQKIVALIGLEGQIRLEVDKHIFSAFADADSI